VVGVHVPDRSGTLRDVVLGYDTFAGYQGRNPSLGSVPGRVANRIAKGAFSLDGADYELEKNDGDHHLHGGSHGFHKSLWEAAAGLGASVVFTVTSEDGAGGYPGRCTARVTYTWTDDNTLLMDYEAVVEGKPTIVNLTNHCYFNLRGPGEADVKGHQMMLKCAQFTPVGDTKIPTGELATVEGTAFDFREGKTLGQDLAAVPGGPGYDHNLVIQKPEHTAAHTMVPFALVVEPSTGISLEAATTQPGVQLFTDKGDCVKGIKGKLSYTYPAHGGFCLETQNFPDAVNKPGVFPSPVLRPGEKFTSRTAYKFGVQPVFKPLVEGKDDASPPILKWMELPSSFRPAVAVAEAEEPQ
jgi:aldose 1-epimerase